jgi:hypothetical protein
MRWLAIAVALLTLVFVGAGCGGSSDEVSADTDTVIATDTIGSEDTSTDETATDETSTDAGVDTSTDFSGSLSSECLEVVQAYGQLSQAVAAAGGSGDVSSTLDEFEHFADSAPDEIQSDLRTLFTAYAKYFDDLKGLGIKEGSVPTAAQLAQLSQASEAFNDPEVTAASTHVSAWADENCKSGG